MKKHHTRRSFLKAAAGAATFPMIVPSSVLGQSATAPSNRVTVGIVGTGTRGRYHANEIYALRERVALRAIADVNVTQRETLRARLNEMYGNDDCACYNDYRELIARDDIDAVVVAVPDHWHALIALAAVRAGKNIYLEKPFAYSIAEGRAIVDAVKEADVVFQHGTQQRSDWKYRVACQLALNGYLGELKTIRVGSPFGPKGGSTAQVAVPDGLDYDLWLGPAPKVPYTEGRCDGAGGKGWYHIRDYSGGWITAWGSHDVDIAQWGHDLDRTMPVTVEGEGEVDTSGAYDAAWRWRFECKYADGVTVVYASEDENPHGVRFEGSEGWVFVNRGKLEASNPALLETKFKASDTLVNVSEGDSHWSNFVDGITKGAITSAPLDAAHLTTATCHLCNIALDTGRKITWDQKSERIVGDDEANKLLDRPMRAPWSLENA
jgi:predicted dehydrogenase